NNLNGEDMGRPKGAANKPKQPSQAEQLLEALQFVSVAGTKDDCQYKEHVVLNNKFAVCYDGVLTAGYPIVEGLECCPHLGLLRAGIRKCGQSLVIAELESGALSIKGDKLRAIVPCLPFTEMPDLRFVTPDPSIAAISDALKEAMSVCGVTVSES